MRIIIENDEDRADVAFMRCRFISELREVRSNKEFVESPERVTDSTEAKEALLGWEGTLVRLISAIDSAGGGEQP